MNKQDQNLKAFTVSYDTKMNRLRSKAMVNYGGCSKQVVALWDTGATGTCISHDVQKDLGLISIGRRDISTPSGHTTVNTYLVDIELPNGVHLTDITVMDSEIGSQGLGMLIGMDIIGMGDFAVSNAHDHTVFTFRVPSQQTTDYAKQISVGNILNKDKRKKR